MLGYKENMKKPQKEFPSRKEPKLALRISAEAKKSLKLLCIEKGTSMQQYIMNLISNHLGFKK